MSKVPFKSAVYLVMVQDNSVLLHKRQNSGFEDGNYGLPSGHIEENETVINAAVREAFEETNVKINPNDLTIFHVLKRGQYIDFFLTCNKRSGDIKNMEPHKCSDLDFYSLNSLPHNTIKYIKDILLMPKQGLSFNDLTARS